MRHQTTTLMSKTFSVLLLGTTVFVRVADTPVVKPMRGMVESSQANSLTLTTRNGQKQSIELSDQTAIRSLSNANLDGIKADNFVGSATIAQRRNRSVRSCESMQS